MSFIEFVNMRHDKIKEGSDYFFLVERSEICMRYLTKTYYELDADERAKDKFFDWMVLYVIQKTGDEFERVGYIKLAKTYNKNDYYMSPFFSHCLFKSKNVGFINYRIEFNPQANFKGISNEGFPTYPTFGIEIDKFVRCDHEIKYIKTVVEDKKNVLTVDKFEYTEDFIGSLQSALDYRAVKKANKSSKRGKRQCLVL
ncbi:hypothetical protein [Neptuniibacter sp.]|uniref:hypothetical protein n=1 Tax=Neptuniibacter sp. TaxID=1962643 RepID=UPI003B5BAEEC